MPVKVISRSSSNALSSGTSTSLKGNVMDWVETVIRVEAFVGMHTQDNFTVQVNTDNTLKLYGANWADLGFEIGDSVTGIFNSTDATNIASAATSTSLNKTVVDIQGDIMELNSTVNGFVNVASFMPGQDSVRVYNYMYLNADKTFTGVEFSFNQMLNTDLNAPTLNSILDATNTAFQMGGLDVTNTSYVSMLPMNPQSGNGIYSAEIKGVSKVSGVSTFDIKVIHNIVGFYDETSDITNQDKPEWFNGIESPTDTYKVKFQKDFGDDTVAVESSLDATVVKKIGNVGWFNENRNGLPSNYAISNVVFEDATANVLTGIQTNDPTTITFTVTDDNGNFDSVNSDFLFGIAFAPLNRSNFNNNSVMNLNNLCANTMGVNQSYSHTASPVVSTIAGFENLESARIDITSYHFLVVSPTELTVEVIVDPVGFNDFLDTLTLSDRQLAFWVSVGDVVDISSTDRVNLLYPCLAVDNAITADPYTIDNIDTYPYNLDYYTGTDVYPYTLTKNPLFTEDDLHINYQFKVEDNNVISKVSFGIDIADLNGDLLYVADRYTENLINQPVDFVGTQQINIESSRQFKYTPTFKDNRISLQRESANDVGTNRGYSFTAPYRVRNEWWKNNLSIPTSFFNANRPLNNLNFEWFRKDTALTQFRYFIELTIIDENGVETDYRNTYDMDLLNYNDDARYTKSLEIYPDNTYTTASALGALTNQYTAESYAIIEDQDNFVKAEFIYVTADISNYKYCEITLEVEDGAGWLSMWKIRSDQTPEANNPLQPLAGQTALQVVATAGSITTFCKIDPNLLPNDVNYKLTAQWVAFNVGAETFEEYTDRTLSWGRIIKLSTPDPTEERTFGICDYKLPVLGSTTSTELYKNDVLGLLYKKGDASFDIELFLIDSDGNEYALNDNTYGTYFPFGSFNYEPNVIGFQVAWRQVLSLLGEGCYSFKRVNTEFGVETTFYSCCYELKEFSVANAENTVRVETVQNGLIEDLDINFKGLNWGSHLRFEGSFGYQEPNYDQDFIVDTNNNNQLNRQDLTSEYLLKSKLVPHKCITKQLWEYYLRGTEIFISDYNSDNHSYDYISFAVALLNPESTKYIQRNRSAIVTIRFKERVLKHRLTTVDGDRPASYLSPSYVYANQCPTTGNILADLSFIGTEDQCNIIFQAGGITTYTSVDSSANVGTITFSTDNVTFSAFTLPFTPTVSIPYYFKRSTATVNGYYIITD